MTDSKAMEAARLDMRLENCPFCDGAMMERHALWPSEGDTDSIIHAEPTDCPLTDFGLGTTDEGASVRAAWNRRPVSPPRGEAAEAARRINDPNTPTDTAGFIADAVTVARAYLSTVPPPAEGEARSDISFERAMELGAMVLKLHERGLELANIKEKADEWTRNAQDYRSICYAAAPILAVKLRDALNDLEQARVRPSQPSAEEARKAVIEECAKVADDTAAHAVINNAPVAFEQGVRRASKCIAAAIRALSNPVTEEQTHG